MLVKESIAFQRYKDPKDAIFGKRPDLQIGDFGHDYNGTIVKVEDILTKQEVLEGDYEMFDSLDNYSNSDLFYATVTMKDNPDVPASKGEQGIYPAEFNYKQYWGLNKIERSLVPKSLRETASFQRYKDPKEALGLSSVFHADDLRFYSKDGRDFSAARLLHMPYINKRSSYKDPKNEIIKMFKKTSYLNIELQKNNKWYTMEHVYDDGYRYIEFSGLNFDMTEKLD